MRLKVLVVDDSAVARRLIAGILARDPRLVVVGEASDGRSAIALAERLKPNVITMDIHMPDMDGYEATRAIMERSPTPIVIVSADRDASDVARSFRALEAGALTVLPKPVGIGHGAFDASADELVDAVRLMADVKVFRRHARRNGGARPSPGAAGVEIVAIGASTGGPAALATVLARLPADLPAPVLIAQHLVRGFDAGLAEWLDGICSLDVRLALAGEPLAGGTALLAPHGAHLGVTRRGRAVLSLSDPVGGHRPSASYLFSSVARAYGPAALGVIMTGMGEDGVAGLTDLKAMGGAVIAQDEGSCVVHGMPRAALRAGVVDQELTPERIAAAIVAAARAAH